MKILKNSGNERVIDVIRPFLRAGSHLDMVSPSLSLFAFGELLGELSKLARTRLLLPPANADLALLGTPADRAARNRLQQRWLAKRCADWLEQDVELRHAVGAVPQGALVLRNREAEPQQVVLGSLSFSTDGLGITPGNPLNLIQASENADEKPSISTRRAGVRSVSSNSSQRLNCFWATRVVLSMLATPCSMSAVSSPSVAKAI
jgi:hypothetical protein